MKRASQKVTGAIAGLALALTVGLVQPSVAFAESILVPDQATAEPVMQALMEPIMPFVAGGQASTTNILQLGSDNQAHSTIDGQSNLSLIQQAGTNNRAVQSITGNSSALLLVQGGNNNSVIQASEGDRNFQLVGVSGSNNDIAYIQKGDDLAGALDVRDSKNSTVLAIQTPQSGRYLMPSGLRGLENKAVVIVPGRMYVFNKR